MDRRQRYSNKNAIENKNLKIDIKFDITELDLICSYILSENNSIHRGNIINLRNLFNIVDLNQYSNDQERLKRIDFIKKGIEARLDYNLTNTDMIFNHIFNGIGNGEVNNFRQLNKSEVEWVNSTVSEIIHYHTIYNDIDNGLALLTEFKSTDYINRKDVVSRIEKWISDMQVKFRRSRADNNEDLTFSLDGENLVQSMLETYKQLTSPSNKLIFGTQALNILTGGGVEAARVYTLLGLPGEGKSSTLIDMAIEIKRYNKNYICQDATKKPCVVLLVMENSIKETIQRIFSMCVGEDMINYNEDEIINILKTKGNLSLSGDDPIDLIVKFRPNLSEDTSYLYTLCEDLEDEGYEVICLIQDYIKRIRSTDGSFNGDLRLQLGAVINEFKTFATLKNIPVITASQLNRTATSAIDEARIKNKADLVRLIGRSNVGESNLIIENSDWVALIAPEYDKDGKKYLGIQRVKSRYFIPGDAYCAYIPYIPNTIKFIEDINRDPEYKLTMKDEVKLNTGLNTSAQGVANEIVNINDTNLLPSENNIFENATFSVSKNLEYLYYQTPIGYINSGYITPRNNVEMCKIVNTH
jgi:replicative DNA helicase